MTYAPTSPTGLFYIEGCYVLRDKTNGIQGATWSRGWDCGHIIRLIYRFFLALVTRRIVNDGSQTMGLKIEATTSFKSNRGKSMPKKLCSLTVPAPCAIPRVELRAIFTTAVKCSDSSISSFLYLSRQKNTILYFYVSLVVTQAFSLLFNLILPNKPSAKKMQK